MRPRIRLWSILFVLSASFAAFAQEPSDDDPDVDVVKTLISQLGDQELNVRLAAVDRLTKIGTSAVEALRLAPKRQSAYWRGDFEAMIRNYRRLVESDATSVEDARWLGHAGQLACQWKDAATGYAAVIYHTGRLLDQPPAADEPGLLQQQLAQRERLREYRAAAILITARIQRFYLKDLIAAEKTLRRIYRSNAGFSESLEVMEKSWESQIEEGLQPDYFHDGRPKFREQNSLQFSTMVLRELANVQQLNEHHSEALQTWRRVHLITRNYVASSHGIDEKALDKLIEELPDSPDLSLPGVTLLDASRSTAEFNLADAASLAKSHDNSENRWSFVLSARKGFEFESLEFTCDIEQQELRYGGQFSCWGLAGEIGSIDWPNGKEIGRAKIAKKFEIEPGTGLVHFLVESWEDKFKVHSVKAAATFRPRVADDATVPAPVPGFSFQTEYLPKGGSITINGKSFPDGAASHGMPAGKHAIEYAHPRLKEPRKVMLDLKPAAWYGLFMNLDSPFTSDLMNLRGFNFQYGPSTNIVKIANGRYLVAWAHGGLRFADSVDLVNWSEPAMTGDSALFHENHDGINYECIFPTLYVDKSGLIWVAYFSNQLDIDQLNTGGFRLFLRNSKNGREWSAPRQIRNSLDGWPPSKVQIVDSPDGRAWMVGGMQFTVADSPANFKELSDLDIPLTNEERSHARNPHPTIDVQGRIHLVWDHFGQKFYYSMRDVDGVWSKPAQILSWADNQTSFGPQLLIRNEQLVLIYNSSPGAFFRRGSFKDGVPDFGDAIKITSHTAPLVTARPFMTVDDSIVILSGKYTVWKQTATINALFAERND